MVRRPTRDDSPPTPAPKAIPKAVPVDTTADRTDPLQAVPDVLGAWAPGTLPPQREVRWNRAPQQVGSSGDQVPGYRYNPGPVHVTPDASGARVGAGVADGGRGGRRAESPPLRFGQAWSDFVKEVFHRWALEQKEFAVRLQRRRWHRLGEILQRSLWAKEFRGRHFTPIWEPRVVKRWQRRR